MRHGNRFAAPGTLVAINNIPRPGNHRNDPNGTLRIRVLCRNEDLEHSTIIGESRTTLAAAAELIADPILRTRGTSSRRCATLIPRVTGRRPW